MVETQVRTDTRPSALRALLHNFAGVTGGLLIIAVTLAAVFAPVVAPYDPVALNPAARLQGPSPEHLVGTDQYGRDTFSRIVYGGRVSLSVAFASVALAALVGGLFGLLSGYYRGWLDALIMRVTDVLLSFPAILLAIALLAFFGGGTLNLVLAIGIIYTGPFVRVTRAAVFTVREELYVEAGACPGGERLAGSRLSRRPQRCRTLDRGDDAAARLRHPRRSLTVVFRARGAAARAELGADDCRRSQLFGAEPLGDGGTGARHHGDRARL